MEETKQNNQNSHAPDEGAELVDFENVDPFELPKDNPEATELDKGDLNLEKQDSSATKQEDGQAAEEDRDARSVFVKNVHYSATKNEIEEHFNDCGEIKLITIVNNKITHQPQG